MGQIPPETLAGKLCIDTATHAIPDVCNGRLLAPVNYASGPTATIPQVKNKMLLVGFIGDNAKGK